MAAWVIWISKFQIPVTLIKAPEKSGAFFMRPSGCATRAAATQSEWRFLLLITPERLRHLREQQAQSEWRFLIAESINLCTMLSCLSLIHHPH